MTTTPINSVEEEVNTASAAIADPVAALDRPFVLPEGQELQTDALVADAFQDGFLNRMNFRIGELELFCKPDDSREVVEPPVVEPVPNTISWFKGIANIRGNMTPVVDLGEVLGNRAANMRYAYLLLFGKGSDSFGVLVDALPRNEVVDANRRLTAAPPLPALLENIAVAAYSHNNKICIDLSIASLFKTLSANLRA